MVLNFFDSLIRIIFQDYFDKEFILGVKKNKKKIQLEDKINSTYLIDIINKLKTLYKYILQKKIEKRIL
tara:strand:+ start:22335 stop:22541 length:207 start_codon:yes stop_codon:yes gene_type:complete